MKPFLLLLCAALALAGCTTPVALPPPPVLTITSDKPAYAIGDTVTLAAHATGDRLTYQWLNYYGSPVAGATAAAWSFGTYSIDQSGIYTCVVNDAEGRTASAQIYVTIDYPPAP